MAKPLAIRITAALKPSARIADIRSTLAEAEAECSRLTAGADDAAQRAEDPSLNDEDANFARRQAEDFAFAARRMARAVEQLKEAETAKLADESYLERRRVYEAAKTDNETLVERLRDRLPCLLEELAELAAAVHADDQRITAVNRDLPRDGQRLRSAEIVARGALNDTHWPNSIGENGEFFARLTKMQIPRFDGPEMLWPPREHDGRMAAGAAFTAPPATATPPAQSKRLPDLYRLSQKRYCGSVITGVRHMRGICGVGNEPVTVRMIPSQVSAAKKLGLSVELLQLEDASE